MLACISGCRRVIGFKLPRGCVLCANLFALRGQMWVRARKSSPCALKTPQIRRFCACWASFFAEKPLWRPCWESYFARGPRECMICTTSFGITRAMIGEWTRRRLVCWLVGRPVVSEPVPPLSVVITP